MALENFQQATPTLHKLSWNLIDFSAKSLWTPVTVSDQLAFIDTFFLPTFGGTYFLLLSTFNESYLMVFAGIMTLQFKRLTNPDGNSLLHPFNVFLSPPCFFLHFPYYYEPNFVLLLLTAIDKEINVHYFIGFKCA